MAVVSMKQLLEAGVHFGHQTRRWNPKMAQYIFTERNGIYIIDLQKTVKKLEEAYMFVRELSAQRRNRFCLSVPRSRLAIPSRKKHRELVLTYVNATLAGRYAHQLQNHSAAEFDRLEQLRKMEADGTFDRLPKKEVVKLELEIEKLEKFLGGIKEMKKLPGALFVVDPRKETDRCC